MTHGRTRRAVSRTTGSSSGSQEIAARRSRSSSHRSGGTVLPWRSRGDERIHRGCAHRRNSSRRHSLEGRAPASGASSSLAGVAGSRAHRARRGRPATLRSGAALSARSVRTLTCRSGSDARPRRCRPTPARGSSIGARGLRSAGGSRTTSAGRPRPARARGTPPDGARRRGGAVERWSGGAVTWPREDAG